MPFYNGTLFDINKKEMRRYAGLNAKVKDFAPELVEEAEEEAISLAEPKGVWEIYPYSADTHTIEAGTPMILQGQGIADHLKNSFSVVVLAVTVGPELEKESTRAFKEGAYTKGLLLDAAATAATEHLADQIDEFIQKMARQEGRRTVWRFSPGYGDWPITQQKDLARLAGAEKIGIHVTDHFMLDPRKSVTAVIGLSACGARRPSAACQACSFLECPFRQK